jgi:hypothetical protein
LLPAVGTVAITAAIQSTSTVAIKPTAVVAGTGSAPRQVAASDALI